jgi:hypothetical protein
MILQSPNVRHRLALTGLILALLVPSGPIATAGSIASAFDSIAIDGVYLRTLGDNAVITGTPLKSTASDYAVITNGQPDKHSAPLSPPNAVSQSDVGTATGTAKITPITLPTTPPTSIFPNLGAKATTRVDLSKPGSGLAYGIADMSMNFTLKQKARVAIVFNATIQESLSFANGVVDGKGGVSNSLYAYIHDPSGNLGAGDTPVLWGPNGKGGTPKPGDVLHRGLTASIEPFDLLLTAGLDAAGNLSNGPKPFRGVTVELPAGTYGIQIVIRSDATASAGALNPPKGAPEPSTMVLAAVGLPGLLLARRRGQARPRSERAGMPGRGR